jgi:hypothetical protein
MRAYLNDKSDPNNAHPAFWAVRSGHMGTVYTGDVGNNFGPNGLSSGLSLHVWWSHDRSYYGVW